VYDAFHAFAQRVDHLLRPGPRERSLLISSSQVHLHLEKLEGLRI
jgi:hypothetical protein